MKKPCESILAQSVGDAPSKTTSACQLHARLASGSKQKTNIALQGNGKQQNERRVSLIVFKVTEQPKMNNFPRDNLFREPFYVYEAMLRYCVPQQPKRYPDQPHPCEVCAFNFTGSRLCDDRYLYISYRRGSFEVTESLIRYWKGKYKVWIVPSMGKARKKSTSRTVEALETFSHDGIQMMINPREQFHTSTRWLTKELMVGGKDT
jgi:hypothetical protein